jgi:O-6-methylguanine DNA methyltransferase
MTRRAVAACAGARALRAARPVTGRRTATPAGPGDFARRVLLVVRRIPPGRVCTYGDVARLAGRPRAARATGRILASAPEPGLPYHRVIGAGGALGGFGGSPSLKAALLTAEGLVVRGRRVHAFAGRRWCP